VWFLFFPFFLFAGVIENNITSVYKKVFPTIKINHIIIKNFKPQPITYIDTSNINPKKVSGMIKVNNSYIFYKLDAQIKVLKSTKIINKNEPISLNNSRLDEIKFKNFYTYPLTSYQTKVSKMYIPQNRVIYNYMLKERDVISRGETIQVISKSGGIEISFEATAMQNGKVGDRIRVKKDNKIYNVKIDKNGDGKL
jgi:flagella basal body P-ring formation protein FlgA